LPPKRLFQTKSAMDESQRYIATLERLILERIRVERGR
jgi:hypothetical protein